MQLSFFKKIQMAAHSKSHLFQPIFSFLTKREHTKKIQMAALTLLLAGTLSSPVPSSASRSHLSIPLLNASPLPRPGPGTCPKTFGSGYSPLNDPSSNQSNPRPKEMILLDGSDRLIIIGFPTDPSSLRKNDRRPSFYLSEGTDQNEPISLLSFLFFDFQSQFKLSVFDLFVYLFLGGDLDALEVSVRRRRRFTRFAQTTYTKFGCLISAELSYKVKSDSYTGFRLAGHLLHNILFNYKILPCVNP